MYKTICLLVDKDQFKPFNYHQNAEQALESMGGNSGNNIFEFALQKMMLTKKQCIKTIPLSYFFKHVEEINEQADALVYSPANILASWTKETGLKRWNETLQKFKIPKYLVDSKFIESFTTQHWGRYYPNQKRNLMQQEK